MATADVRGSTTAVPSIVIHRVSSLRKEYSVCYIKIQISFPILQL